ncbi:hypothetical protein MSAN_02088700 [Mycena sanguinolenta]|uniref:Uncharacterized protein n=1 Tax=Mycena sanguinolenta TaxID=230812 RepID=A0A8H6XIG5_9AGAR|nr:hypothetical protein MSAN_02088700 [Mycena sanguinolenta]
MATCQDYQVSWRPQMQACKTTMLTDNRGGCQDVFVPNQGYLVPRCIHNAAHSSDLDPWMVMLPTGNALRLDGTKFPRTQPTYAIPPIATAPTSWPPCTVTMKIHQVLSNHFTGVI